METGINKVGKLSDVNNWAEWKFQLRVILRAAEIIYVVTGGISKPKPPEHENEEETTSKKIDEELQKKLLKWNRDYAKAQKLLVTSVEKEVLQHLMCCARDCI
ncbi:hypothetical protein JTB14_022072 [Gonioctena quinquepunctata]|nr:hypothetical protein JTB14_022072 [Gonioctena quinquepunctata]